MKENSAQNRAISHDKGPMMLLAGPGSGKTTTITKRVVNLIQEKKSDSFFYSGGDLYKGCCQRDEGAFFTPV